MNVLGPHSLPGQLARQAAIEKETAHLTGSGFPEGRM